MKFLNLALLLIAAPAFAGGVSGGGGNTKPAHPVTAEEVRTSIAHARLYVYGRLNSLEWFRRMDDARWAGREALWSQLFSGDTNVIDSVLAVPIHVEENGPCLDPAGNPMDGSARLNPAEVCLSLPRLTEKLGKENLRAQVIALAVHEYSHLMGTTEADADFLQNMVLDDLTTADYIGFDKKFDEAGDGFGGIYYLALIADDQGQQPTTPAEWLEGRATIKEIRDQFSKTVTGSTYVSQFMLSGRKMQDYYQQTSIRMELMERALCILGQAKDASVCQIRLDHVFQGDQEIDYHTYMVRNGYQPGEFIERPGVVFRRVHNIADLKLEAARLKPDADFYVNLYESLDGRNHSK